MNIKEQNGKIIGELLDRIGPEDSMISTGSDWDLLVYRSDEDGDTLTIEMCLKSEYGGDPLFDPLMRIELTPCGEKSFAASPLYYQSKTVFYEEEVYAEGNPSCYNPKLYEKKAGELDGRLSEWLTNLRIQGYLTGGTITRL